MDSIEQTAFIHSFISLLKYRKYLDIHVIHKNYILFR